MEVIGTPLGHYVQGKIYRGILTGFNKAFVIDGSKRAELIVKDPKSAEIIKPLAVGDDIRRWHINFKDYWLIFTRRGIDINIYPAIKEYLEQWKEELTPKKTGREEKGRKPGKYKWYEIQDNIAYHAAFDKPKIIFPDIAKESRFAVDVSGSYLGNTGYIVPVVDLYLLGVLNSQIVWKYAQCKFSCLGDPIKGGRFRFIYQSVSKIPIPTAPESERAAIASLVQKCLDAKGQDVAEWEVEIDDRVARLYGLTVEEIKIIRGE